MCLGPAAGLKYAAAPYEDLTGHICICECSRTMRCYLYMAVEQLGFRKKDGFYHAHFITQGLVQDKSEWRERGKFNSRRQALWETSLSQYSERPH
jgi:hypothetical protein